MVQGFLGALEPINLLAGFLGCLWGTLVGLLPGVGPVSGLCLLLPLTRLWPPEAGIIMLTATYYGAMYGGTITTVLLKIPGEVSSIPSMGDGHALARQGRAGYALAVAAIGSWLAGTMGVLCVSFLARPLAEVALKFGPIHYLVLIMVSLTLVVSLSGESILRGVAAGLLGLALSMVGMDPRGVPRFTMGSTYLYGGLEFVSFVIGIFAVAEILENIDAQVASIACEKIGRVFPSLRDLLRALPAAARGSIIGCILGLLPGMVPAVSAWLSYDVERRISKTPDRFGKGAIEGVAGPESANNATATTGLIPLMSFGLPTCATLAVLLAGFMLYGLQPGPLLFQQHADVAFTIIASMYLGNVILLILNLPLVGLWARAAQLPYGFLAPVILVLCAVGAYSVRNNWLDVWMMLLWGVVGLVMKRAGWPAIPMVLGMLLGPLFEEALVRAVALSGGVIPLLRQPLVLGGVLFSVLACFTAVRRRGR